MLFDAFQLTTWCLITIFAVVYAVASGARDERETVFGGKDKASLCLPTGEDNLSSDEQIMAAINNAAKYTQFEFSPRILECLKVYQNNVHHLEGWLYNHVILMLLALRYFGRSLTETQYRMLELAIFWSDLGKLETKKDSPKKVWEDGRPQSTAFGHAKKSAEMYRETHDSDREVAFLIEEHMNAHQMESQMEKIENLPGYQWLLSKMDEVSQQEIWDNPWTNLYWENFNWPHGQNLSKKQFAWAVRWNNPLLKIKQQCDEHGRISDESFN